MNVSYDQLQQSSRRSSSVIHLSTLLRVSKVILASIFSSDAVREEYGTPRRANLSAPRLSSFSVHVLYVR